MSNFVHIKWRIPPGMPYNFKPPASTILMTEDQIDAHVNDFEEWAYDTFGWPVEDWVVLTPVDA
jgi:hypothetical protein